MFQEATEEQLERYQEASNAHIANLQWELDELAIPLGEAKYDSPEWIDRVVDLELRYRFHYAPREEGVARAGAIRQELRDHGIRIARYDLPAWLRVGQVIT